MNSTLVNDILDLLLEDTPTGNAARKQMAFLSIENVEYTGVGAFISFKHKPGSTVIPHTEDRMVWNGLVITSPEVPVGAEATLFVQQGRIDCLEICSFDAEYPEKELETYRLQQAWEGSPGRFIEKGESLHS